MKNLVSPLRKANIAVLADVKKQSGFVFNRHSQSMLAAVERPFGITARFKQAVHGCISLVLLAGPCFAYAENNEAEKAPQVQEAASIEDVKQSFDSFAKVLESYSYEQRDQAIAAVREEKQLIQARAKSLEKSLGQQTASLSEEVTEKRRETLQALKQRQNELQAWSQRLENSSQGAWQSMKSGLSKAYSVLAESVEDAEQAFDNHKSDKNSKANSE